MEYMKTEYLAKLHNGDLGYVVGQLNPIIDAFETDRNFRKEPALIVGFHRNGDGLYDMIRSVQQRDISIIFERRVMRHPASKTKD